MIRQIIRHYRHNMNISSLIQRSCVQLCIIVEWHYLLIKHIPLDIRPKLYLCLCVHSVPNAYRMYINLANTLLLDVSRKFCTLILLTLFGQREGVNRFPLSGFCPVYMPVKLPDFNLLIRKTKANFVHFQFHSKDIRNRTRQILKKIIKYKFNQIS